MKRTGFKQKQRKPMARKAKKKGQPKSATGPMVDRLYFWGVKSMPCCACGTSGPSDGHHCKDRPPHDELGVYRYFPGNGERSADFDAIPLCRRCHDMYHRNHGEFAAQYGPDYSYIAGVRDALAGLDDGVGK